MALAIEPAQGLQLLYNVTHGLVQGEQTRRAPDFTLRQLVILLTVYLEPPPHTVRGLAQRLGVSKPAVSRALTRMGRMKLVARRRDEVDKRNVLIQRTFGGALYVERLADTIVARAAELSAA